MITNLQQQYTLNFTMKNRFITAPSIMFNSCYWNRYRSPITVQYKLFFRDIKSHRDVCLIVEYYTVPALCFLLWFLVLFIFKLTSLSIFCLFYYFSILLSPCSEPSDNWFSTIDCSIRLFLDTVMDWSCFHCHESFYCHSCSFFYFFFRILK